MIRKFILALSLSCVVAPCNACEFQGRPVRRAVGLTVRVASAPFRFLHNRKPVRRALSRVAGCRCGE